MIYQPSYWRRDLRRSTTYLRLRAKSKRWSAASVARLERTLMVGCYAIRKLLEGMYLPESVSTMNIRGEMYPTRGRRIRYMSWPDVTEYYRIDAPKRTSLGIKRACDVFVHSRVFVPARSFDGAFQGVFVTSEREQKHCFFITARDLVSAFDRAGTAPISVSLRSGPGKNIVTLPLTHHRD